MDAFDLPRSGTAPSTYRRTAVLRAPPHGSGSSGPSSHQYTDGNDDISGDAPVAVASSKYRPTTRGPGADISDLNASLRLDKLNKTQNEIDAGRTVDKGVSDARRSFQAAIYSWGNEGTDGPTNSSVQALGGVGDYHNASVKPKPPPNGPSKAVSTAGITSGSSGPKAGTGAPLNAYSRDNINLEDAMQIDPRLADLGAVYGLTSSSKKPTTSRPVAAAASSASAKGKPSITGDSTGNANPMTASVPIAGKPRPNSAVVQTNGNVKNSNSRQETSDADRRKKALLRPTTASSSTSSSSPAVKSAKTSEPVATNTNTAAADSTGLPMKSPGRTSPSTTLGLTMTELDTERRPTGSRPQSRKLYLESQQSPGAPSAATDSPGVVAATARKLRSVVKLNSDLPSSPISNARVHLGDGGSAFTNVERDKEKKAPSPLSLGASNSASNISTGVGGNGNGVKTNTTATVPKSNHEVSSAFVEEKRVTRNSSLSSFVRHVPWDGDEASLDQRPPSRQGSAFPVHLAGPGSSDSDSVLKGAVAPSSHVMASSTSGGRSKTASPIIVTSDPWKSASNDAVGPSSLAQNASNAGPRRPAEGNTPFLAPGTAPSPKNPRVSVAAPVAVPQPVLQRRGSRNRNSGGASGAGASDASGIGGGLGASAANLAPIYDPVADGFVDIIPEGPPTFTIEFNHDTRRVRPPSSGKSGSHTNSRAVTGTGGNRSVTVHKSDGAPVPQNQRYASQYGDDDDYIEEDLTPAVAASSLSSRGPYRATSSPAPPSGGGRINGGGLVKRNLYTAPYSSAPAIATGATSGSGGVRGGAFAASTSSNSNSSSISSTNASGAGVNAVTAPYRRATYTSSGDRVKSDGAISSLDDGDYSDMMDAGFEMEEVEDYNEDALDEYDQSDGGSGAESDGDHGYLGHAVSMQSLCLETSLGEDFLSLFAPG